MKRELEEKLFNKYPGIFKQKDLDMTKTCMCWGIECGDGWYDLLEQLCHDIEKTGFNIQAVQVKEKYGGLRFYVNGSNDEVDNLICKAENMSYKVCEECGSKDSVTQTEGWIITLCKKCKEAYEKRRAN